MGAVQLSKETFQQEVIEAKGIVIVDFWSPKCAPCMALLPQIEELAGEVTNVKVCKLNVDDERKLAREYKVFTIPTVFKFEDGVAVKSLINPESKALIREEFDI